MIEVKTKEELEKVLRYSGMSMKQYLQVKEYANIFRAKNVNVTIHTPKKEEISH